MKRIIARILRHKPRPVIDTEHGLIKFDRTVSEADVQAIREEDEIAAAKRTLDTWPPASAPTAEPSTPSPTKRQDDAAPAAMPPPSPVATPAATPDHAATPQPAATTTSTGKPSQQPSPSGSQASPAPSAANPPTTRRNSTSRTTRTAPATSASPAGATTGDTDEATP